MKNLINDILGVIYPEELYCICCGDILPEGRIHGICDRCISRISWVSDSCYNTCDFSFDRVLSLASYDFYVQSIIYDLKMNKKVFIADYLGRLMAELLVSSGEEGIIVPVPMAKKKQNNRGYNQADLLAKAVAKYSGMIYEPQGLIKTKDTGSMRLSSRNNRAFMLSDSIQANKVFADQNVILVDDVITTGTTANICAKELKKAGAKRVIILTFSQVEYIAK